ncbi:MAG: F-type H+-transporting ATPase subunit epsilon [Microgenomates group bacterium LiPW_16]|nr:MAG: F-type H+-transporting ATPase subunit epsilon [Microgenomates group bacterium LiPW_16]
MSEQYLAIGGGFMEVTPSKVTILVTRAVHAEEINEAQVLEAKKNAEEILEKKPTGEDLVAAQALFRRSLLDLKILRRRRPSKIPS